MGGARIAVVREKQGFVKDGLPVVVEEGLVVVALGREGPPIAEITSCRPLVVESVRGGRILLVFNSGASKLMVFAFTNDKLTLVTKFKPMARHFWEVDGRVFADGEEGTFEILGLPA